MERIVHQLIQGTQAWDQFRLDHHGASEAAAMLGLSKNVTRNELLRAKHTGIAKEFSEFVQTRILDKGHEVEALARPIVEEFIGQELYPATYSYGKLSASCDGLTIDGAMAFEHKQFNAVLADAIERGYLPEEYMPQCQQVMMVTGAEEVIFVVSDGTAPNMKRLTVLPSEKWQARIRAGWKQFDEDLANYQIVETAPEPIAAPTLALPALSIQVNGALSLISNLDIFGQQLAKFIDGVDNAPQDDQGFADCEAAIKTLQKAQDALEQAESSALAQTSNIEEMRRTVALYRDQARTARLMLEKVVKARKESIRIEIVQAGRQAFADHMKSLDVRLGRPYMPDVPTDFGGVIKNKRTIASLRDAVDGELARAKIAANEVADRIQLNLSCYAKAAAGHEALFADLSQLVLKDTEAFPLIVIARVTEYKLAEERKLEVERERIRAEEEAKAQARAKAQADAEAKAERDRIAAEQRALETRQRQEREAIEAKERQARLAQEEAERVARQKAEDEQRARDAAARKEREAEEAKQREAKRIADKQLDIYQRLESIVADAAGDKKFAPVVAAIRTFLSDKSAKKKAA